MPGQEECRHACQRPATIRQGQGETGRCQHHPCQIIPELIPQSVFHLSINNPYRANRFHLVVYPRNRRCLYTAIAVYQKVDVCNDNRSTPYTDSASKRSLGAACQNGQATRHRTATYRPEPIVRQNGILARRVSIHLSNVRTDSASERNPDGASERGLGAACQNGQDTRRRTAAWRRSVLWYVTKPRKVRNEVDCPLSHAAIFRIFSFFGTKSASTPPTPPPPTTDSPRNAPRRSVSRFSPFQPNRP